MQNKCDRKDEGSAGLKITEKMRAFGTENYRKDEGRAGRKKNYGVRE
jgi:hypothetical protein